jgi:hypothetical protein
LTAYPTVADASYIRDCSIFKSLFPADYQGKGILLCLDSSDADEQGTFPLLHIQSITLELYRS